jgi:Flp pilus assembly protein TadG
MRYVPGKTQRRRAMTMVETALVLVAFLLLLFGVYEYARLLFMKHLLDNSAREGARLAVVHTSDYTTAQITSQVTSSMANMQTHLSNVTIQVYLSDSSGNNIGTWTDAQFGQYIAVQIDGDFNPILPTFLSMSSTIHIRGKSVMYAETN